MLLKRLREYGECTAPDGGTAVMRVDLYQGASKVWELEVRQLDGGNMRWVNRYESEEAARRAIETAYEFGRHHGTWRVQRAADYEPIELPARQPG
jgi:hypothetical protein